MQLIRILALPFLPVYAAITWIRNGSYNKGIIHSNKFDIPVIGVGNLSVGGTGKTPTTEYLIRLLKDEVKVGVVSRGYLRRTKGYLEVKTDLPAIDTGDEPLQMKRKFGDEIIVAVDRQRIHGITSMLTDHEDVDVILLDDSYQHRSVKPGISILLTTWQEPYFNDHILPIGDLREFKWGSKRADIILVTKCPPNLSKQEMQDFGEKLRATDKQLVAFATIKYGDFRDILSLSTVEPRKALVVTGIANPGPFLSELRSRGIELKHLSFADHHNFSDKDYKKIRDLFDSFAPDWVITTEKDSVRMLKWKNNLNKDGIPVCYLEMEIDILNRKTEFDQTILTYVRENKDSHRIPEE